MRNAQGWQMGTLALPCVDKATREILGEWHYVIPAWDKCKPDSAGALVESGAAHERNVHTTLTNFHVSDLYATTQV